MTKPIIRQIEYVSGRISHDIKCMAIVIFFTFVAAILNVSISPTVSENGMSQILNISAT